LDRKIEKYRHKVRISGIKEPPGVVMRRDKGAARRCVKQRKGKPSRRTGVQAGCRPNKS
jgi:hypothetical protein